MSKPKRKISSVEKIVLCFDICSSTKILEDLVSSESHHAWSDLLFSLKAFMGHHAEEYAIETYKFQGDGWILLVDRNGIKGKALVEFCEMLAQKFEKEFNARIRPRLQAGGYQTGLTFGVDRGSLLSLVMDHRPEYIGRALNVAVRLQGAISQEDKSPEGKCLISNAAFVDLGLNRFKKYKDTNVTRWLKNVSSGSAYQARKITISEAVVV